MYLSSTKCIIQNVKNINKKTENINENKNIFTKQLFKVQPVARLMTIVPKYKQHECNDLKLLRMLVKSSDKLCSDQRSSDQISSPQKLSPQKLPNKCDTYIQVAELSFI